MKTIRVTNLTLTFDFDDDGEFDETNPDLKVLVEAILDNLDYELRNLALTSVKYLSINNISDIEEEDIEVFNQDGTEVE